jgi:hypothetical protein
VDFCNCGCVNGGSAVLRWTKVVQGVEALLQTEVVSSGSD